MNFNQPARPSDYSGEGDKYLMPLIEGLAKILPDIESNYATDLFKIKRKRRKAFACIIIEFAEDLYNDIGLWKSIEYHNQKLFNTPLPIFVKDESEIEELFDKNRIKFLIYNISKYFIYTSFFSPFDKDFDFLAESISKYLREKFINVPKESGLKLFLSKRSDKYYQLKSKLLWIATNSYLFKLCFHSKLKDEDEDSKNIMFLDSFICEEHSIWSGLTAPEILSKAILLPLKIQNDIIKWSERLFSIYRILSYRKPFLEILNIFNKTKYQVKFELTNCPFEKDMLIFGGIIPFNNYWYWSGTQQNLGYYDKVGKETIQKLKEDFIKSCPNWTYRTYNELLNKAIKSLENMHSHFYRIYGSDFAILDTADEIKEVFLNINKLRYEELSDEMKEEYKDKFNFDKIKQFSEIPDSVVETYKGIGIFFNQKEGLEMMLDFYNILNGLKKQGENLTIEESHSVRNFICSDVISPTFVKYFTKDYGVKSIQRSFFLNPEDDNLEFLLHKFKGRLYKNRYPNITLVN